MTRRRQQWRILVNKRKLEPAFRGDDLPLKVVKAMAAVKFVRKIK